MNTTDMTAPENSHTTRQTALRHLGVALLATLLASATACGSDRGTAATGSTTPSTSPTATSESPATTAPAASTATAPATTTPTTTATRPTATFDELVGAADTRVHVRCVGQGNTTVLLIAGFGGDTTNWVNIEPDLATRVRVCSYDRPGTGTSDPATANATFTTEATDLHTLLNTVGEPGPYVVVGHSFGGAEAITFASLFADEVAGIVLIDASPTTWPAAACSVTDDGSDMAAMMRGSCTGTFLPTGNSERLDVAAAFVEVAGIGSLGSLPMAVITATDRDLADMTAPDVAQLTEVWNQGQQDWMSLSTASHLVSVANTSHHIEIDQPGVVLDEITRLLP